MVGAPDHGAAPAPASRAKLALGTVQFGLAYGLMHPDKPIARTDVREILDFAWRNGIDMLDTAAGYGEAETVIAAERPPKSRFAVVSKILPLRQKAITDRDVDRVMVRARESAERLAVECLDALLVHHAPDLLVPGGARLHDALMRLKSNGLVRRIGVSVYDPETLRSVLAHYAIDVVQLPLNILDQRFLQDGMLDVLAGRQIEIHARSVFLQGVLVTDLDRLPSRFDPIRAHLSRYHAAVAQASLSRAAAALGFVGSCRQVDRIVIGVDSLADLRDNVRAFGVVNGPAVFDYDAYAIDAADMIDPRRW
jgi:aryl-alcohol dehydrogenase-like predicted oxidoreductase